MVGLAVVKDGSIVEAVAERDETAEREALELWLDAMTWLEPLQPVGEREVEIFAGVLGDSLSEDDEILAALLALAHADLRRAHDALQAYAQAPHPGMHELAQLACEEWRFWSERAPVGSCRKAAVA